jgi:hypothetical protein
VIGRFKVILGTIYVCMHVTEQLGLGKSLLVESKNVEEIFSYCAAVLKNALFF